MRTAGFAFLIFALTASLEVFPQSTYQAGSGQASIEPDQSLVSLHLGGYGAPRDGRFTLQWISKGRVPDLSALTGSNDKLYIVSNGNILWVDLSVTPYEWKSAGKAENILSIAGSNGKLYAVNNNHELLESIAGRKIKWKKISIVDNSVTLLAASGNKIFAGSGSGSVWTIDLSDKSSIRFDYETITGIVSLSANRGKLYAITSAGIIYSYDTLNKGRKWLKIAYRNNETISEDIRQIAFADDRIFGISKENILYKGEHRSEGNLTARALAVRNGEKTVVMVNVDVCGLNDTFTGLLKHEIYLKDHIPASAVFINSSHTHFAPVSQNWFTWQEPNQRPDSAFLYGTVRTGIIDAIDKALNSMAPAELSFGRGITDIGYARSLRDHPEIYDSAVDVIHIAYTDNRQGSYLFLAACHPVFSTAGKLNYTISANYPGVARKLVEERTGTSNSLFLQGTAGDINPKDNGEYITGEKLANEVIAVSRNPMKKIEGPISCYLDTIKIPITPLTREEIFAFRAQNDGKKGDIYAEKNIKWCDLMLEYYQNGTMPSYLPVYINTINIGNWKLVGFSRETTTGYGLGVKKLWPDRIVSIAGYTNDVSSYLPTHMHLEAKVYEGLDSFFWYGMPNVFPMNTDELILDRIKSLGR